MPLLLSMTANVLPVAGLAMLPALAVALVLQRKGSIRQRIHHFCCKHCGEKIESHLPAIRMCHQCGQDMSPPATTAGRIARSRKAVKRRPATRRLPNRQAA